MRPPWVHETDQRVEERGGTERMREGAEARRWSQCIGYTVGISELLPESYRCMLMLMSSGAGGPYCKMHDVSTTITCVIRPRPGRELTS